MPFYSALSRISPQFVSDHAKDKKLCLSVPKEGHSTVIDTAIEISHETSLSWIDTLNVTVLDTNKKALGTWPIFFGQSLTEKGGKITAAPVDDANAPLYGIRFVTDTGATLRLEQTLAGDISGPNLLSEKWYDGGAHNITPSLDIELFFCDIANAVEGKEVTASADNPIEKFTVSFSGTTFQVVYVDSGGDFSLAGPDSIDSGTILGTSRHMNTYYTVQNPLTYNRFDWGDTKGVDKQDLAAYKHAKVMGVAASRRYNAADANKKKVEVGWGPISLAGYVDISTLEIGVELAVIGISLGQVSGNLNDGVVFKVDLVAVSGSVNIYLEGSSPKEVWVSWDLKIPFSGGLSDKKKIFDI